MSRIQRLLIENSNRPEVQQQIREAAVKGAANAGYNLIIGYDNQVKYGTRDSYDNQDAAEQAAWDSIQENVNLD
jgi:hypothetical protein